MSSNTLTPPSIVLGPLSQEERTAIMRQARTLCPNARRTYRRLLALHGRGLSPDLIARSAIQARENCI